MILRSGRRGRGFDSPKPPLRFGSFWNFLHLRTMTTLLILPYAAIGQVAVWGTVIITLLVAAAAYIFKQKPPHFPVRSGLCGDCLACRIRVAVRLYSLTLFPLPMVALFCIAVAWQACNHHRWLVRHRS